MDLMHDDDISLAVEITGSALAVVDGSDWEQPARQLEWTRRRTLDHMADALLYYAGHVARRATARVAPVRSGKPEAAPDDLGGDVTTAAAILSALLGAAPAGMRAFHPAGMADADGFRAMACDELLVHTFDITDGWGEGLEPPRELIERVLNRLFPWAPEGIDPWPALLWCNGRIELPAHPQLDRDWLWHCAPLDEWDGSVARRHIPPQWT